MASYEYLYVEKLREGDFLNNLNQRISHTGALPCFCLHESKKDVPRDKLYKIYANAEWSTEPICDA